jgi:hypothetical protein
MLRWKFWLFELDKEGGKGGGGRGGLTEVRGESTDGCGVGAMDWVDNGVKIVVIQHLSESLRQIREAAVKLDQRRAPHRDMDIQLYAQDVRTSRWKPWRYSR